MKNNTESFVLTLRLETLLDDEIQLEKRFRVASHIYNVMVKEARRRLHRLYRNKTYKDIMKQYRQSKKLSKNDKKTLSDLRKQYGLSEYAFHEYLDEGQSQYKQNIDSFTRQKIGTTVWRSAEKNLFGNGQTIHYKKRGRLSSVEGKSNATGIRYRNGCMQWLGLNIPVRVRKRDKYAKEAVLYHHIKYCRLVRKWHKHHYRYYVQLVMEGQPPQKRMLDMSDSRPVGIDIGTSTIAVVAEDGVLLQELGASIPSIEKEIRRLNRKLDRQRRANNPQNYNSDGTIRRQSKSFRRTWSSSRRQRETQDKIRTLYQKRAECLKQSHIRLANTILEHGTDIYVEKMQFQSLAKKAKETKISPKTGRYQRKKRFGKSVANHAPSMLLSILDQKLQPIGKQLCKVSTYDTKASQLNHITGEYTKIDLSTRWKRLDASNRVQRDLYSAFLLMNCEDTVAIDIQRCLDTYDTFKQQHDDLINKLQKEKQAGVMFPTCMGL